MLSLLQRDVLYCTASNWNLVVIGVDRFTAVRAPLWYRDQRHSVRRVLMYVLFDWAFSALVCVPPTTGFLDLDRSYQFSRDQRAYQCTLFTERSYVAYSALGSFLVPLLLLLVLYTRIFLVLHQRASALRAHLPPIRRHQPVETQPEPEPEQVPPPPPPPPPPPLPQPQPASAPATTLDTTTDESLAQNPSSSKPRLSGRKRVGRSRSTRETLEVTQLPEVPGQRRRASSQNLPDLVLEVHAKERASNLMSGSGSASHDPSFTDTARRSHSFRGEREHWPVRTPSSVRQRCNTSPSMAVPQCVSQRNSVRRQKRLSFQLATDGAGETLLPQPASSVAAASQSQESRSSASAEDGEDDEEDDDDAEEEAVAEAEAKVEAVTIGKEIRRNLIGGLPLPTFEPIMRHIERKQASLPKPNFVRREAAATRRMLLVLAIFLVCTL